MWPVYDGQLIYELRSIQKNRQSKKLFFKTVEAAAWAAAEIDESETDCYFGVVPRLSETHGKDDVAHRTLWLWADVDTKKYADTGRLVTLSKIDSFDVRPTILVDSGNGWHAYWQLHYPGMKVELASKIMKSIATHVDGDAVQNPGRILRIVGTRNWKTPGGKEVRMMWDNSRIYNLSDFIDYIPEQEPIPAVYTGSFRHSLDESHWSESAEKGQRSERDFALVMQMIAAGWTDEDIHRAFALYPNGIGAKYAEKGSYAREYLDRTIIKARSVM